MSDHPEVRHYMAGFIAGLLCGVAGGGIGMSLAAHKWLWKEADACLQRTTMREARECLEEWWMP